jgi:DNA-binding NarL/FixJ family response regulator
MIRVMVVDDHPLIRSAMRALLDSIDDVDMCGEAASGTEAVEVVQHARPDVVVMDLEMDGMDGFEATRRLLEEAPDLAILVLTMHDNDETVFSAMRAGARGYLLKGAQQDEILRAIRAVAGGDAIFGASVGRRVLQHFTSESPSAEPFPELTVREREILGQMASGASNSEIARTLFLSPKTVSNNVSVILDKLQVPDRAKAIVRARQAGLGGNRR